MQVKDVNGPLALGRSNERTHLSCVREQWGDLALNGLVRVFLVAENAQCDQKCVTHAKTNEQKSVPEPWRLKLFRQVAI